MNDKSKRSDAQRLAKARYQSRKLSAIGSQMYLPKAEAAWFKAKRKELRLTWLELLYRGLGYRRVDAMREISAKKRPL